MDLTVFGATGGTGGQLVRQALDRGHTVTAVVRDPARLDAGITGHSARTALRVVAVPDVTDAEALRGAITGRDAVLSGIGPSNHKSAGIATAATRSIVRAMDAEQVRRIVVISAAPVGPAAPDDSLLMRTVAIPGIRRVLRDVYADLAAMEQELQRSGLDWTSVRPPQLTDKPLTGHYRLAIGAPLAGRSIPRADLAHAMLSLLDDPASVKQTVGVAS
jgi:putative NADH-flavin reductase